MQAVLVMHTEAKRTLIDDFVATILRPRGLQYRLQLTGPTATCVVESAIKLARKVTKRRNVMAAKWWQANHIHGRGANSAISC